MKIKITTDSASDLCPELYDAYSIAVAPMIVLKENQPYQDGVNISINDIFSHVEAGGSHCTTSALNIGDFIELFSHYADSYDAVIHVSIGSGFSSSCQNASLAAAEFSNVYVVDSQNLSSGEGLVVLRAAELAREGTRTAEEILSELNDLIPRIDTSFLLDRLDYMVKGGRCSAVTAMGATLLHLHPCIEVSEGKLRVARKYRGSLKKCLVSYVKDRLENTEGLELQRCFVTHSGIDAEISREVQKTVAECQAFESILETVAGCTITCHCGNNTLGILYVHSK
ncbi:MAG: DegV family protein [Bacillota bacterium]|nr:DegV family protein [Bacillota bacterium]